MIIWIIDTIISGFLMCSYLANFTYPNVREAYPLSSFNKPHIVGKKDVIPKYDRLKFMFSKETLGGFVLVVFLCLAFYVIAGGIIEEIINKISDDHRIIFTKYRNYTTIIFFIFLYISTNWVIINIHFNSIYNDKEQKAIDEFRKENERKYVAWKNENP